MARAPKPKRKDVSLHSRAARRAEPSVAPEGGIAVIDDKDSRLKIAEANFRNDFGGIVKKRAKHMTRQQRLRKEKGAERHEQNEEKLLKKVADSRLRGKRVKNRNATWEETNTAARIATPRSQVRPEPSHSEEEQLEHEKEAHSAHPNVEAETHSADMPVLLEEDVVL